MKRAISVAFALAAVSAEASADLRDQVIDKILGTSSVSFQRTTVQGTLEACGFDFVAVGRDFSTKSGAPYRIAGSYYLRRFGSKDIGFLLKLGVFNLDAKALAPSRPANAFVSAKNKPALKPHRQVNSDMPGYALFIYKLDDASMATWFELFETSKLDVYFNRKDGQQDVRTTIDLTIAGSKFVGDEVIRTISSSIVPDLAECSSQLLNDVAKANTEVAQ